MSSYPSATFIPLLFYEPLPYYSIHHYQAFWRKLYPPLFFEKNQKSNLYPFCKMGELQLWLMKTTYFTYLLLMLIQYYQYFFNSFCVFLWKKLHFGRSFLWGAWGIPNYLQFKCSVFWICCKSYLSWNFLNHSTDFSCKSVILI